MIRNAKQAEKVLRENIAALHQNRAKLVQRKEDLAQADKEADASIAAIDEQLRRMEPLVSPDKPNKK